MEINYCNVNEFTLKSLHFSVTYTRNLSHKMVITTRTGCYDVGVWNNQALATQSVLKQIAL